MRHLLLLALAAAVASPPLPAPRTVSAWRFLRVITPAESAPLAAQCVVLDADLYARAAAGLRDVRLVQDGRELAYATDESFDDRASIPAALGTEDRALYEVSLKIAARPSEWPGAPGNGAASSRPEHPPGWFYGQDLLPAHVPVERVRLEPAPAGTEFLSLRAAAKDDLRNAEVLETTLTAEHPAAAFTVGANLQEDADVRVGVHGQASQVTSFVLEMRRRQMCYQPRSAAPLLIFFGNENARPVRYDYAAHYQPTGTPLLARMGPVQPNPAYRPREPYRFQITRTERLLLALTLSMVMFLVLAVPVLRRRR